MNISSIFIQKYLNNKELAKSFTWRLIQVLSRQGSSAVMFFITAHLLSKEDMGMYNYLSSILLFLTIFVDFGISTASSKYITQYNTVSKEKVGKVLFSSGLIISSISFLIIVFLILFAQKIFPNSYTYIYYILPLILVSPLTYLLDGIFRGLKKFRILAIITLINGVLGILLSFFFVKNYGLVGAILTQVFFFGTYVIALLIFHRGYENRIDWKIVKDVVSYALYFGIASLGYFLFSRVNILIFGSYNLLEQIAVYELLNKIYVIFLIPFTVLGQVLAPNVVEFFSSKMYEKVLRLFRKSLLYSILLSILFIPISMFLTKIVVSLLFPAYLNGVMNMLLLPVALTSAKAIPVLVVNTGLITSTGHGKYMAIENITVGILNVVLNIFVIQKYGYVGVVWVSLLLQCISTAILYIVYYRKLKGYQN